MPDTTLDVRTEPPARVLGPLAIDGSFASFLGGTLLMVVIITAVALAGSAWLLVPAFAVFLGVTGWVFASINRLLDDHDQPSD